MQPCGSLCRLPDDFAKGPLEAQAAMLRACRLEDARTLAKCDAEKRRLVQWIADGVKGNK